MKGLRTGVLVGNSDDQPHWGVKENGDVNFRGGEVGLVNSTRETDVDTHRPVLIRSIPIFLFTDLQIS